MNAVTEFPNLAAHRLLNLHSPGEIAAAIEILIDVLNFVHGDAEAEDATDIEDDFVLSPLALAYAEPGPGCNVADRGEVAYVEWSTMRGNQKGGPNILAGHEDDEDDDPDTGIEDDPLGCDPEEDMCLAGDDRICSGPVIGGGAINNDLGPGDDTDNEREQMHHDVPMLPVVSAEHNIFTDARTPLGISNMQSSFVGRGVRSADSGDMHTRMPHQHAGPGQPV